MAMPDIFPMELSQTYIIYRDIHSGDAFDPTSPLLFFPPKGSDELFDALCLAFPLVKSHSERMREAIIGFLLQERQEANLHASPAMTLDAAPSTWASISTSGSSSCLSSPEFLTQPTPASYMNSPQPQVPQLSRQTSAAGSNQSSPPALDQMTGVFSLSTAAQPKQRIRRKMTESEKTEYRKRRIVKACDKCAKRKRKCPHNQAEMESIPNSKSSAKIAKSKSTKSVKKAEKQAVFPTEDMVIRGNFSNSMTDVDLSFQFFDDFTMFEDPFSELDVDTFWPFDHTSTDFAPLDNFTPDLSPAQQSWSSGHLPVDHNLLNPMPMHSSTHVNPTVHPHTSGDIQPNLRSHQERYAQQLVSRMPPQHSSAPQHDPRQSIATSEQSNGLHADPGKGDTGRGDHALWEYSQTGQQRSLSPTNTAHLHNNALGQVPGSLDLYESLHEPHRDKLIQYRDMASAVQERRPDQGLSLQTSTSVSLVSGQAPAAQPQGRPALSSRSQPAHLQERSPDLCDGAIADRNPVMLNSINESRLRTSTSVSQTSGQQAAALPKGRPQPSLSTQSQGRDENSHASSSVESLRHLDNLARPMASLDGRSTSASGRNSELYMPRRRLSTTKTSINRPSTGPLRNADNSAIAAQDPGVAFPRLEHTANDHHDVRNAVRPSAFGKSNAASFTVRDARTIDMSMASLSNSTSFDRLSDHKRYRDHHGRAFSLMATMLLGAILLTIFSATTGLSESMLFLASIALLSVDQSVIDTAEEQFPRCTEKNSSWFKRSLIKIVKVTRT